MAKPTKLEQMHDEVLVTRGALVALLEGLVDIGVVPREHANELVERVIENFPPNQQENARFAIQHALRTAP